MCFSDESLIIPDKRLMELDAKVIYIFLQLDILDGHICQPDSIFSLIMEMLTNLLANR